MDPEWILVRHRESGATAKLLPETVKVGAASCDVVEVGSADGRFSATLFVDRATKMVVQMTHGVGATPTVETYTDYRVVAGIQIAHQRDTSSSGETSTLKVKAVDIDPVVDPELFSRPAAATQPSGTTP
jgi:hypothetical protein